MIKKTWVLNFNSVLGRGVWLDLQARRSGEDYQVHSGQARVQGQAPHHRPGEGEQGEGERYGQT